MSSSPVDKVLVRLEQHEPTAACHDIHCYIHNVDEPGPGYVSCGECFHLYRSAGDLRRAHRCAMCQAMRADLKLLVGDTWRSSWWRFLWHLLTVRAEKIYSCPFCGHDF